MGEDEWREHGALSTVYDDRGDAVRGVNRRLFR